MKIRGFLLILSLLFICYLGENIQEGLHDEIDENYVFKKQTKYSRHKERQKRCLNKILNNKKTDKRANRHPNKQHGCHNKNNRHDKCKHLLPHHRKHENSDKYFFNKRNYMLKTKMVPPVSPKGPYIKVVNENNRRHNDDEGTGKHDKGTGKHVSKPHSNSCKSCANCKNGLGFTCNKGDDYSFLNMNHVPPPLTANVPPPMSAPVGKFEPRPMLSTFSAFGK